MANEVSTTVATNDTDTEYITDKLLLTAEKETVFHGLGDPADLPKKSGSVFSVTRYEKLGLPLTTLTQGTTPGNTGMTVNRVQATVEQWGAVVTIYDMTELIVKHSVFERVLELEGIQYAETIDREIQKVLAAGTTVQYAGGRANRNALTTSDVVTTEEFRKMRATLRKNGARFVRSGKFIVVLTTGQLTDLMKDNTLINASSYSNIETLFNGEIGKWMGFIILESNHYDAIQNSTVAPTSASLGAGGTLTSATNYRIVLVGVDTTSGFDSKIDRLSQSIAAGGTRINVTFSTDTGLQWDVYIAAATETTLYRVATAQTAATYIITSAPSSGTSISWNAAPAASVNAHQAYGLGKQAFTVVDLDRMKSYVTPNTPSDSDPLVQRRKVGWKTVFKAVINNNNFLVRLESHSGY